MKIGILTFHWATNYGAIMQCLALQRYLVSAGHDVKVINYKPRFYDDSLYNFFLYRKFLKLGEYIDNRKKENSLALFRKNHLNLTERVYTYSSISEISSQFDVIISGSDQVANPAFLMFGEGKGIISPAYFLGFKFEGKRVGYALSFGCVTYPEEARKVASKYIGLFDSLSVRESSGVDIVKSLGRNDAEVVPDPTILMESSFYHVLADDSLFQNKEPYVYSFFIRHISDRKTIINRLLGEKNVIWNNEDGQSTMQGWLSKIKHAEHVITDSFHCVVMCLKLHKPFVVVTEQQGCVGMNDRLYTLLNRLGLSIQICYKEDVSICTFDWNYDWTIIDTKLKSYSLIGENFLKCTLI